MFYKNLISLCNQRGEKLTPLLERLNISTGNISNWKNGKTNISAENLQKIADYFDVSVDYLLGREKKEPAELTTDSVMSELKNTGLYNKLSSMSEDDRKTALATLSTLCENLGKNRK